MSLSTALRIFLIVIAFDFSKARKSSQKVENNMAHSDFLNGSNLFLFIHDIYHPHIPLSILSFLKEVTCCTKNVVSTKKVIHIEVTLRIKIM